MIGEKHILVSEKKVKKRPCTSKKVHGLTFVSLFMIPAPQYRPPTGVALLPFTTALAASGFPKMQ